VECLSALPRDPQSGQHRLFLQGENRRPILPAFRSLPLDSVGLGDQLGDRKFRAPGSTLEQFGNARANVLAPQQPCRSGVLQPERVTRARSEGERESPSRGGSQGSAGNHGGKSCHGMRTMVQPDYRRITVSTAPWPSISPEAPRGCPTSSTTGLPWPSACSRVRRPCPHGS
jgi:hypothetical protein